MATIGRGSAVVQFRRGRTIKGKSASLAWGAVHLALLSTGEDRAKALIDWTWAASATSGRPGSPCEPTSVTLDSVRVAPSGDQFELSFGNQRAVIVEVGGGIRTYSVGGNDILDGYGIEERCPSGRGQGLIPWPNRLRDGRYRFDDRDHQLPLTEPDKHNAIHGLTRWANWTPTDHAANRVTMRHRLHPQPGYPFALDLEITYSLADDGLCVHTTATNIGTRPAPYGTGAHPYLASSTPTIDTARLRAPGRIWLPTDDRGIPTGAEPVTDTDYDFQAPRLIRTVKLDTGYTDLVRDSNGIARVELLADTRTTTLWLDQAYPYVMLFTGDSLPDPNAAGAVSASSR